MTQWYKENTQQIYGVRRLTYIALLTSVGLILHLIEAGLPPLLPIPGAKLGLANITTLLSLSLFGIKEAGQVVLLRIFLASFLAGTFLTLPFYLSLFGGILAFSVMAIISAYGKNHFSIIGLSISGALFHNLGQILIATLVIGNWGVLYYLPYLTLTALPTGFMMGISATYFLAAFRRAKSCKE